MKVLFVLALLSTSVLTSTAFAGEMNSNEICESYDQTEGVTKGAAIETVQDAEGTSVIND